MTRRPYLLALAAVAFVMALLYATLKFGSYPPDLASEDRVAAVQECHEAVREEIADARFPFSPTVSAAADGAVLLAGSVDSGDGITATRRNYECFLRAGSSAGVYRADSVHVWQSH